MEDLVIQNFDYLLNKYLCSNSNVAKLKTVLLSRAMLKLNFPLLIFKFQKTWYVFQATDGKRLLNDNA